MLYEIEKFFGKKMWIVLLVYILFIIYVFTSFYKITYQDSPWTEFYQEYNLAVKVLFIGISVFTAPFFAGEDECGMAGILFITKKGHSKVPATKVNTALVVSLISITIFLTVTLICTHTSYAAILNTPISEEELLPFASDQFIQTNGQLVLNMMFHTIIANGLSTLLCLYLSAKIKKTLETSVLMVLLHLVFSSGLLGNIFLGSHFWCFQWIGILIGTMPLNLVSQNRLHIEKVSIAGSMLPVIYVCDLIYIFLSVGLYYMMTKKFHLCGWK